MQSEKRTYSEYTINKILVHTVPEGILPIVLDDVLIIVEYIVGLGSQKKIKIQ